MGGLTGVDSRYGVCMTVKVFRTSAELTGHPGLNGRSVNTFHFTCDDTPSILQGAIDKYRDFYTAIAAMYVSAAVITVGSRVISFDPEDVSVPGQIYTVIPRAVAGTGGSSAMAAQVAMCVSWHTAFAGKSFRGRSYLGPFATSVLNSATGLFTSALVTSTTVAANALLTGLQSVSVSPLLFSRKNAATQVLINATIDNTPDTQRGRIQ